MPASNGVLARTCMHPVSRRRTSFVCQKSGNLKTASDLNRPGCAFRWLLPFPACLAFRFLPACCRRPESRIPVSPSKRKRPAQFYWTQVNNPVCPWDAAGRDAVSLPCRVCRQVADLQGVKHEVLVAQAPSVMSPEWTTPGECGGSWWHVASSVGHGCRKAWLTGADRAL